MRKGARGAAKFRIKLAGKGKGHGWNETEVNVPQINLLTRADDGHALESGYHRLPLWAFSKGEPGDEVQYTAVYKGLFAAATAWMKVFECAESCAESV